MGKKTSHSSAEAKGGKPQASGKPGSLIGETALIKVLYTYDTNADVLTGAKMMELKTLVDQTQPKIIGVFEVKPKNFRRTLTTQEYIIPDYNLELHGLGAEDSGRGLAVYIHKSLSYTRLEIECQDNFIPDIISCEIKLAGSDKLMFTCVYRSPSEHSDKNCKLNDVIRKLCSKEYSHKLVVGDFNYPQIDWDVYSNQSTAEDDSQRFIDVYMTVTYTSMSQGPPEGEGPAPRHYWT